MLLKDPELGIEVNLPEGWNITNTPDGMEIEISRDTDCKVIILRGGKASNLYISKKLREIGCETIEGCEQKCGDKIVYIKRLGSDVILAYCKDKTYEQIIQSLRLSEPSIGYLSSFKRISSPRHKWYLSIPENWKVEEFEPFGDSILLSSGNIKAWIIIYPSTDFFDIDYILNRRFEILTKNKKIISKEIIEMMGRKGISATLIKDGKEHILGIEVSKHKVKGDVEGFIEADFNIIMETGYITPAHVKEGVLEVIGKIFSSYAFGVNFLSEFLKMENPKRFLYALAFESYMLDIDACEIFKEYSKKAEKLREKFDAFLNR